MSGTPLYKDTMGRFRTQSLFWEFKYRAFIPVFTLKDEDHTVKGVTYISMRRLYLEYGDPTEYEFAMGVLGSWAHWMKITQNTLLRVYVVKWREELELKLRAEAIREVRYISQDPTNKGRLGAAKWMADKGWDKKRGRPSKAEVTKERKLVAGVHDDLDEDYNRIIGPSETIN